MNENENENENETRNQEESYVAVDITSVQALIGKMKHVEINGKEILIANIDGNYYAVSDRCGHSNASLSRGNLKGNVHFLKGNVHFMGHSLTLLLAEK